MISAVSVGWYLWWDGISEDITLRVITILVFALITIIGYSRFFNKSRENIPPLPPGPRGLPLIGNLLSVEPEFHLYFTKLSKTYGPIFKLQLGSRPCIVICSNLLAKQILKDQDAIFANRDPPAAAIAISYGCLDIAWRPHSDGWRRLRKVCVREMMSNSSIEACYMLRRREVRQMVKEIHAKVGSPVNIDLQGIQSKTNKLLLRFDRFFESVIAERNREDEVKGKDFLQFLLEFKKQGDDKSSFSITELKALFMDIILAGTDTTSSTVEWAMTEIMQHRKILSKVCEELETTIRNDQVVEESHLAHLPYLEAVIKETLRLHPPVPLLIPHSSSASTIVAGFTIPKGSRVFFNLWQIHRDPEVWNDPLEFQPDKFLKEPGKFDYRGNDFNFLPFGSGRRICAGIPLAERMVTYALATLLHSFDWKLQEGTKLDFTEKFGIVLKKMKPLVCIPTPRLSTAKQYC